MSSDLSCPYCNSPAAVPVGAHPGQRIPCPRCGESFPYRGGADDYSTAPSPPPITEPPPVRTPQRFSNTGIALAVLAVMVLMGLLGLLYALKTEAIRRSYDLHLPKTKAISIPIDVVFPLGLYILVLLLAWFRGWNRREATSNVPQRRFAGLVILSVAVLFVVELGIIVMHARSVRPSEDEGPPVPPVQPKELLALGYLPSDTDLIIGLHAGELLSEPVGRDLIEHLGSNAINAHSFEGWSGLKLAEMDHAVLGITLDASVSNHFTLVVRARRPIDQGQVRETLKAGDAKEQNGRKIYPCTMSLNFELIHSKKANLWFADDQTLVVAGAFEDGPDHKVPLTPETGLKNLRPELRELIEERFGPSSPFWIVGRMPPDNVLVKMLSAFHVFAEELPLLTQLKRFGVWMTVYPSEVALHGSFECSGEVAAQALYNYLDPKNRHGLQTWLAGPDAGPMEKAFNQSMKRTQHGAWVDFQAKASAEAIRAEKR